ncbi:MAG TPA: hypothetical protein VJL10_08895 [Anaerolineales bacterium]|nr:hypothetical protein [Anaerolineales bacterium]
MKKEVKEFADFYGLLDNLIAQESAPILADDELTINRVAGRADCGRVRAKGMIKRWLAGGLIEYVGKRSEPMFNHVSDAWKIVKKGV